MPIELTAGLLVVGSYLIGSIPTAVWLSRSLYGIDIRTLGSGNAGSTNMYRSFGFFPGFLTQIVDIAKGALATALPWLIIRDHFEAVTLTLVMLSCGLAAVTGHTFPIFAGFKGGKGVNTILGMMTVLHPVGVLVSLLVFVIVLLIGRMVSLASLSAVYSFLLYVLASIWVQQPIESQLQNQLLYLGLSIILVIYITWTHRSNIARIRSGTERKINF